MKKLSRRDFLLKVAGAGAGLAVAAAVNLLPEADAVLEVELPEIEVEAVPFKMLTGLDKYRGNEVWQYQIRHPGPRLIEPDTGAIFRPTV